MKPATRCSRSRGHLTLQAILRDRLTRLRTPLRRLGLRAMLITDPVDVSYLSGFMGEDSWLLVTDRDATLLTDGRFTEQAARECPSIRRLVRKGAMTEALAGLVERKRVRKLGFDPATVTVAGRSGLARAMKKVRLVEVGGVVSTLRICKDPMELRAIARAVRVAETAWAAFRRHVRLGMTERRLAAELDHQMRLAGADGPAFDTICAIDASGAMPHARPGNRRLRQGSVVVVDFGARVDGYVSDLTRVLFAGKIAPRAREVYTTVLEAQRAGIAAVRPGALLKDVDAAVRRVIVAAGLGKHFTHGTGHGIGRRVHEAPALAPTISKGCLEEGMVVTVEPGVYLEGRFGVRIEDDVLVTRGGRRVLSHVEKDLEAMVL